MSALLSSASASRNLFLWQGFAGGQVCGLRSGFSGVVMWAALFDAFALQCRGGRSVRGKGRGSYLRGFLSPRTMSAMSN
jgi:hypothetical protein